MNDEFFKSALNELNKADKIIIGLSGGADSVCLTHILCKHLGSENLICAHVNHGIRGEEALRDQDFAKSFAESLGIEFKLHKADVPKLSKEMGVGEEECGRQVRYEFFNSLCRENSLIATAHNADDNAETILMNLMRGCGLKGLCGIPFKRDNIIRPILSLTREEIESYCLENSLSFVTDSTNNENDYKRNKVRNKVLKEIKEISPDFVKNTFNTSRLVNSENSYLESLASIELEKIRNNNSYNVSSFHTLSDALKLRVISLILKENSCGDISSLHVKSVLNAIENQSSCNVPFNKFVNVKQNILTVTDINSGTYGDVKLEIGENYIKKGKILKLSLKNITKNEKVYNLLFNNLIDCDKIIGYLSAGKRKEGDKFTLTKRKLTKSLKKLFNEMKIPASLRDDVTVIRDEKNVVFIENVGVNDYYKVTADTKNIILAEFLYDNINTINSEGDN